MSKKKKNQKKNNKNDEYLFSSKELKKRLNESKNLLTEIDIIANNTLEEAYSRLINDSESENSDFLILEKIRNFTKIYALISQDMYICLTNKKISNYKKEYIDYFNRLIDSDIPIKGFDYDISPEIEGVIYELEQLKHKYDFHVIFINFLKWTITNDEKDIDLVLDLFCYNFEQNYIHPADLIFEGDKILDNVQKDYKKITFLVKLIKGFIDDYYPYIELLSKDMIVDVIKDGQSNYDNIYYTNMLTGRIGMYYGDSEFEGSGIRLELDFEENPNKYYPLLQSPELDYIDYYALTRNMDNEDKIETGSFALGVLIRNLESINILRNITKIIGKKDNYYIDVYRELSMQIEKILNICNINSWDYYYESIVENVESNVVKFKEKVLLEMNFKLIQFINNGDYKELLQLKKELINFYIFDAPWLLEEFDKCMISISNQIKNKILSSNNMDNIIDRIDNYYRSNKLYERVRNAILNTFATAEFLYDEYINDKEPIRNWDYSFVSILYYQILEKALNVLIYFPYIEKINTKELTFQEKRAFFGDANCTYSKGKKNIYIIKDSIELGVFPHLINLMNQDTLFNKFMNEKYSMLASQEFIKLKDNIAFASKRRNDAAHPLIISYKTAKEDKSIILGESFYEATEIRDLFKKILESLSK